MRELQALFGTAQEVVLKMPDGEEVVMPSERMAELRQILSRSSETDDLTTQEAADQLRVSRPFLIKKMEEGALPFYMVGTHRRIRRDDFETYFEIKKRERRAALAELSRLAVEMEAYEESEESEDDTL